MQINIYEFFVCRPVRYYEQVVAFYYYLYCTTLVSLEDNKNM